MNSDGSSETTLNSNGGYPNWQPVHAGVPVGGFMEPVNKLSIITPYLWMFGLIVVVAVVIVKPWKKAEN